MSFTGTDFVFDGVSGKQYGLMLCNFDSEKQEAGVVGSKLSISEDRLTRRPTPLHYGIENNTPKEFPAIFVVRDSNKRLDRFDIANIAGWLSGHSDYKELTVDQEDMTGVFYKCIITELRQLEVGGDTVGFSATITCDCPYAYRRMADTKLTFDGAYSGVYRNHSNVNDYYFPMMEITASGDITIENKTDGTVFQLTGLPAGDRTITIDTQNQVMTSTDELDLYQYWNTGIDKCFPRFLRGDNQLAVTGSGTMTIQNEFHWNIGH